MKKTLILWVQFLFLWGIFCPWAGGSNQVQKNQESLQHEVTITLKLIQVFVTDKDAKPVTGLGKTDFETHTLTLPQTQDEETKPEVLLCPGFRERGEVDFSSLGNKVVYHYSVASLNPGAYECRTVLRNLETGRTAVSSAPVTIPRKSPARLHLFSPLLVLPLEEEEAFYVKVTRTKEKKSDTISLKDIYPFISNTAVPIMEECRAGISMMLGIVRCLVKDIDQPKIELTARLREQRSLEEVPLTCSLLSSQKTGDLQIMLVQLKFPALKAGDYVLRFAAKEATSGRKSDLSRELKVR